MKKESIRYLKNAREILKSVPVEENEYTDIKPVREACATAYLAVLEAINESLIKRGYSEKELPQSIEGYRKAFRKHLAVHNGTLMRKFENLYKYLHIAGYYRGLLTRAPMVKDAFKSAEELIKKIG